VNLSAAVSKAEIDVFTFSCVLPGSSREKLRRLLLVFIDKLATFTKTMFY
jgi:hypothetical protein